MAHYWMPEHVIQFAAYPQSRYPYADGSGQELPEQPDDAPLQWGDDTYSMSDPHNPIADPVITMAWLAGQTSRIELGSNILVLPMRDPLVLGKALATLDSLSAGRALLGVGVGWAKEEADAMGFDFAKRGRLHRCLLLPQARAARRRADPDRRGKQGRHAPCRASRRRLAAL